VMETSGVELKSPGSSPGSGNICVEALTSMTSTSPFMPQELMARW
jgi:hypothetical protein